ncbi:MAG: ice-binding family protein, partial [Pyrinomonadaceae bacterium]
MDEITTNVPKTFRDRVSAFRYLIVLTALAAVAVGGYAFLPEANVAAQVEDTKSGVVQEGPEVATQPMIDFAIGALKSASGYGVYAERGIVEIGDVEISGTKGDAMRSAEGRKATKELSNAIDAMRQLPCVEVKSGDLTGKSFGPGVYCLSSAELAGEMVVAGNGDAAGTFIFRVAGTLKVKDGSSIELDNGAQAGNVFFVAEDAEIGGNAMFRASVLAANDVKVGSGSTVTDKVFALGKAELENSTVQGGAAVGWIQICKRQQLPVDPVNDLSNRIFHFVVTGVTAGEPGSAGNPMRVPVGSCSTPFAVAAGPQTVTELNSGTLITPSTGTFTGNFELYNVIQVNPQPPSQAGQSSLGLVNLSTRVANVTIVAGTVNGVLTLEFYNRRAITGFVEICKRASTGAPLTLNGNLEVSLPYGPIPLPGNPPVLYNPPGANPLSGGDPDVTGFFQYTVSGVFSVNQLNPNQRVLQVFSIPVGQCTGPIAVTTGDPAPFPPATGNVSGAWITELARPGFYLEGFEVLPDGDIVPGFPRFVTAFLGIGATAASGNSLVSFPNVGGGVVGVRFPESTSSATETLVIFRNRSNPSTFKVCKIAGPGIPINTLFTFTVVGWGPTNAAHPQAASYGLVTRTFDVRAGDPAQGGTCELVPGFGANPPSWTPFQTFVNGTPVYVYENGISVNNTIPQNPGQLRVSQIRQFGSAFTNTAIAGFNPNPWLTPAPDSLESFFTNGPIALADGTSVGVPVNVPDAGLVSDVDVGVRVTHAFAVEDVSMAVVNPAGLGTALYIAPGTGDIDGPNFGSGATDCTGNLTRFSDEAAAPIPPGGAGSPFAGTFQPVGNLSIFDGRGMNGVWGVGFNDSSPAPGGTINCARLDITNSAYVGRAAVFARTREVVVEFTNFRFRPTVLKVCKIGNGAAQGQDYNFTVALVSPVIGGANPGNMFPPFSTNVTVTAGPAGTQEGNCTFVNGSGLLGGAFNQGSTVTITEAAGNLVSIHCPSCGPGGLAVDLPLRRATLSGPNGLVAGVNAVVFTNNPDAPPVGERPARFDFDGDKKADAAVYKQTTGDWS